jgi:hypothetical protein
MNVEQLTAIIYCEVPQPVTGNQFLKYRNIENNNDAKSSFLLYASKFVGAQYVNFYDKKTRRFVERIYLQ